MHRFRLALLILIAASCAPTGEDAAPFRRNVDFNRHWKFKRLDASHEAVDSAFADLTYDDSEWESVVLPHTPRIEPLVVNDMWQGICWYRKRFAVDPQDRGKRIFVEFEAAMTVADVWVNGRHKLTHYGGYLPFTIDITDDVRPEKDNVIAVRLDNRDSPEVPPGKPLRKLDFCWYGGLYRNVKLHVLDPVHITDPIYADRVAGGGVFVRYLSASRDSARLWIQTHVINESNEDQAIQVVTELFDSAGTRVLDERTAPFILAAGSDTHVVQESVLRRPKLWGPDHPYLYSLRTSLRRNGVACDRVETRIGIRTIAITPDGFWINGERMYLRGTNRHQEYPYVGYAVPDNAHRRDAVRIKKAGFDFVRLSHYPQSPAFLDACDELGLLVMDAIPGWQFMGNKTFRQRSLRDCREMIRRDRNHPSVVLWETSLNETRMDRPFMLALHRAAHEEYPGDQCFTAGWINGVYDVFLQARQHGGCHDHQDPDTPCLISEYGDWEYYAQNAGFDQPGFRDLKPEERNSRQRRGDGERRLLQQAMNFQEAHNDNLSTCAIGDGVWVMFDYNRGYDDSIEASGVMDIFRLPKFAYYFFRSQRGPNRPHSEPMVHIASYWTPESPLRVRVFSNCEQVRLLLNGEDVGLKSPDQDRFSGHLAYPPFTFRLERFVPGELEAIGYIGGREAARHAVRTPGEPVRLELEAGLEGIPLARGEKDLIFVYARAVDDRGTIVPTASPPVRFSVRGPARLIGDNPAQAEAGIATILLETSGESGRVEVSAVSPGLRSASLELRVP